MGEYIDKAKLFEHFSDLVEVYTKQLEAEIRETKPFVTSFELGGNFEIWGQKCQK